MLGNRAQPLLQLVADTANKKTLQRMKYPVAASLLLVVCRGVMNLAERGLFGLVIDYELGSDPS
jgi:hypothetical protein